MRILIVDDCRDTCDILKMFLGSKHFEVFCAYKGEGVIDLTLRQQPDFIMLDVALPDISGYELCAEIRAFSDIPILMISAVAKEHADMITGLNLGADGYLVKPIDLKLLDAHIKALCRRINKMHIYQDNTGYSDEYLSVDTRNQLVRIAGQHISLSALEYQLLELLVSNANQVLSSLEINENLWPSLTSADETTNLRTYIRRLRELVEPEPATPRYIINEHGFGYRFITK